MVIPKGVAGDWHPYLTPDEFVTDFNKLDGLTKDNLTLIGMQTRKTWLTVAVIWHY
jgi:alpha-N-arabinofuranosidase